MHTGAQSKFNERPPWGSCTRTQTCRSKFCRTTEPLLRQDRIAPQHSSTDSLKHRNRTRAFLRSFYLAREASLPHGLARASVLRPLSTLRVRGHGYHHLPRWPNTQGCFSKATLWNAMAGSWISSFKFLSLTRHEARSVSSWLWTPSFLLV